MTRSGGFGRILAMALALGAASIAHAGDGEAWSVSKSSGEVWMITTGAQTVSLSQQDVLKPGDTIRTAATVVYFWCAARKQFWSRRTR